MPEKRNIGSDRKRVGGGQDHEVKYEAHKIGTSKQEIRKAVKDVGNSRGTVEEKLKKKN
jgi:transcription antitermination factor NusG